MVAPVQTKAGLPSLVSWTLRMIGFSARGLCCAPSKLLKWKCTACFSPLRLPRVTAQDLCTSLGTPGTQRV